MKRLPIVILMVVTASFLTFKTMGGGTTGGSVNPPGKYEQILKLVGEMLSQGHYKPQDINDAFSKKIFKKFMGDLDPEKNMFLAADVDGLQKKYDSKIDDEIKGSNVEFFLAAGKTFNQRMEEVAIVYKDLLAKPFDFTVDEEVMFDGDKLNPPATEAERKERWRKKLKYMTLERYVELLDVREKNKGKENFVVKTDAELEKRCSR